MGRGQIVEKLKAFLSENSVTDEAKAVYLMVELRKILDHAYNKKTEFLLIRFYCDWVVHTEKSFNLVHIAPVIQKVYDDVRAEIEQGPHSLIDKPYIVNFIYMDALRNEMEGLFRKEGLPLALFQKIEWINFVSAIVQVLTNQPILRPIPEVPRLMLTPSNPHCIWGVMEFTQEIVGHDGKKYTHYNFGNVY